MKANVTPADVETVTMLVNTMNGLIADHVQPVLQQAIDNGASESVIASAVTNCCCRMLAAIACATSPEGREAALAADMVSVVAQNIRSTEWTRYRAEFERQAAGILPQEAHRC